MHNRYFKIEIKKLKCLYFLAVEKINNDLHNITEFSRQHFFL